jgi:dihydroflavonol-4-reductase
MQVLITGGTGFLGRPLVRVALERGWSVSVLVRSPQAAAARRLATQGASLVIGDVTDRRSLKTAFDVTRPELVFHLAGWYELGISHRWQRRMRAVNVEGVENLLSQAAEHATPRVVLTSSTTALGDTGGEIADERFERQAPALSFYETTKYQAHGIALRHQQAGEPVIVACPPQVIGAGDHAPFGIFARLLVRGWLPPLVWAPRGAFTFVHVDDVAAALLAAGEKGRLGEVYFLARDVMTNRQMVALWGQVSGRRPPFIWLPRPLAMAQALLAAPLLRLLGYPAFISPESVRSSYVSFRYSGEKARKELGIEMRTSQEAWQQTLEDEIRAAASGIPWIERRKAG